jgi:hypothetical protein
VPVPVDVVAGEQPVDRTFEVCLGVAAGLDQRDAGGRVWDEHVAQPVAVFATELEELVSDIGDQPGAGAQSYDVGMHRTIIAAGARSFAGVVFAALECLLSARGRQRAVA